VVHRLNPPWSPFHTRLVLGLGTAWLLTHGRAQEAEASIKQIEDASIKDGQPVSPVPGSAAIIIMPEKEYGYLTLHSLPEVFCRHHHLPRWREVVLFREPCLVEYPAPG